MRIQVALGTLVLLALFAVPSAQQITTGVIQGTVTDTTGAVLPGVTVEARNTGTNLSRTAATDADGRYRVSPKR